MMMINDAIVVNRTKERNSRVPNCLPETPQTLLKLNLGLCDEKPTATSCDGTAICTVNNGVNVTFAGKE
jgi:hypothetical protein